MVCAEGKGGVRYSVVTFAVLFVRSREARVWCDGLSEGLGIVMLWHGSGEGEED